MFDHLRKKQGAQTEGSTCPTQSITFQTKGQKDHSHRFSSIIPLLHMQGGLKLGES